MLDIQNGIRSLTEFKQNSVEILKYIKRTHNPAILTVNGRAEVVLLDARTYQEMKNKADIIDSSRQIEAALREMENSKGIPVKKAFTKLHQKLARNEKIFHND